MTENANPESSPKGEGCKFEFSEWKCESGIESEGRGVFISMIESEGRGVFISNFQGVFVKIRFSMIL
jgi:hypothetical protein